MIGQLSLVRGRLSFLAVMLGMFCVLVTASQGATRYVNLDNTRYNPGDLTIFSGDTVVWYVSGGTHTVTGTGGDPVCGNTVLFGGDSCSKTFTAVGTVNYQCQIHASFGMTGVIRVLTNVAPTVSITNPVASSTFVTNSVINIQATAADADNNLLQVVLRIGTNSIITNTTAPFQTTVSNLAAGTYALRAVATDTAGLSTTSAPVNITVRTIPALSSPAVSSDTSLFQLLYSIESGGTYVVEGSTNLIDWTRLFTNSPSTSPVTYIDTNSTNFDFRFYRVLLLTQ